MQYLLLKYILHYYLKTVMKPHPKKSYINITELVTAYQRQSPANTRPPTPTRRHAKQHNTVRQHKDINKENVNVNTRPSSQNSNFEQLKMPQQLFDKLSQTMKIDRGNSSCNQANSIYSSLSKNPPKQHHSNQSQTPILPANQRQKLLMEDIISSQRLFIDPDRWQGFLRQAEGDQKFERALGAFLYSYFIQNYH